MFVIFSRKHANRKACKNSKSSYWNKNEEKREKQSLYTLDELKKLHKKQVNQKDGHQHHQDHHDHDRPTGRKNTCSLSGKALWKNKLHFVELPVFKFGNWIPYIMNHWQCFGSSCALSQVAIKSKTGNLFVRSSVFFTQMAFQTDF